MGSEKIPYLSPPKNYFLSGEYSAEFTVFILEITGTFLVSSWGELCCTLVTIVLFVPET